MEDYTNFKICSDYRRLSVDFAEIQNEKGNPLDRHGYPTYPYLVPSSHGSSFTYKLSDDWFFKRKLQDGSYPHTIFSQHHFTQNYNELSGSFDDLGEVFCYFLSQTLIHPETNEPLIKIPEYKLATYTDKDNIKYRGCLSKNICQSPNEKLITMADMLKWAGTKGNSIDVYMSAVERFCKVNNCICDFAKFRRDLIVNSYFCWKVGNSDNHKHNITIIQRKTPDGKMEIFVSDLIDNGSTYELSVPYINGAELTGNTRFESLLQNDNFSKVNEKGERVFDFTYYPFMHNAFQLDVSVLPFEPPKFYGKHFSYEYCLAAEMLEDKELFDKIYNIEKQFDLEYAFSKIDETYGTSIKGSKKEIKWPPLLKEFMYATNDVKSRTISFVVVDTYLKTAYSECVEKLEPDKPNAQYETIRQVMLASPLQPKKEVYDEIFIALTENLGINIDKSKLASLKFKVENDKSEGTPNTPTNE